MAQTEIEGFLEKFNSFTEKPVKFLTVQSEVKNDVKNFVKSIYDYTKEQEGDVKREDKGALPQLIVEDMDEEQIWQELELQNNECWDNLVWEVANCISMKNDLLFPVKTEKELPKEKKDSSADFKREKKSKKQGNPPTSNVEGSDGQKSEEIVKPATKKLQKVIKKAKPSIVDDKFFKLQEMEEFLLKEERNEGKTVARDSDEESIDLFEDIDDDSEEEGDGNNVMYNDFFDQNQNDDDFNENDDNTLENGQNFFESDDRIGVMNDDDDVEMDDIEGDSEDQPPSKKDKKVRFAQPSSSDDDDDIEETPTANSYEKKSEFEQRQERLKQTIDRLEQKTLKEAPWQLKGEVDASKRPQNSLLQEVVDFDLTTRPAPIITEQTTTTLEEIIRQRIKDKAWDDVVRKEKPVDDQLNFRKTEVLDHAKSKLSLAQVYEAEYLKQKQAQSGDTTEEKEPEAHTEIRKSMTQLFAKLDALCHYHYTPKAVQPDVKIVTNTPAISMEEVAPIATSDAALLAPEEVKKKRRGDLMSKEERTDTDKKRERRKKKKQQKAKGHIPKVTDNRNTKQGTEANDKSFKTSKAFFQQLNDDTTSLIKSNKNKVKSKKN